MKNKYRSYLMNYFLMESGLRKLCAECGGCCENKTCDEIGDCVEGCRNDVCLFHLCGVISFILNEHGLGIIQDILSRYNPIDQKDVTAIKSTLDILIKHSNFPIKVKVYIEAFRVIKGIEVENPYLFSHYLKDFYSTMLWATINSKDVDLHSLPKVVFENAKKFDKETYDYLNTLK